jgi:hypothetical protein
MVSDRLKTERETYERRKNEFVAEHDGKFVVLQGESVLGFYDTYEQALAEGYGKCGLCIPFAVTQISSSGHVHFMSRELIAC